MATKKTKKTKKAKTRIATQLYSFSDFQTSPKKIANMLAKIKMIGFDYVQISGPMTNMSALKIRGLLDDAGLTAIGAHVSLQNFRTDLDDVIDRVHTWGCSYVAIPFIAPEDRKTLSAWKRLAKEFTGYGKILAKEKLTLQYHNHNFEFTKFGGKRGIGGKTALEILYAATDKKYLQAEIDTHWVAMGGGDPATWCLQMKGRMDQIHLKDVIVADGEARFAEIGEGNLNWKAILSACKKAGVKDYIIEQDDCYVTKDPFRSMAISLQNLRAMGIK